VVSSSTPTLGTLIRAREAGAAASPGAGRRLLVVARPGRSGMLLAEGTLTLEQVSSLELGRAELAFLSACQTAIGGVRVLDESEHLAAAFQLPDTGM